MIYNCCDEKNLVRVILVTYDLPKKQVENQNTVSEKLSGCMISQISPSIGEGIDLKLK